MSNLTNQTDNNSGRNYMDPIKKLVEEHRTILAVLNSFTSFAEVIRKNESCDNKKLGNYVRFIQQYADKYHHAKEEDILFEAMVEHGFSKQIGPVAMMLHEHVEGRKYVKFLHEASLEQRELTAPERQAVVNAICGYAELLRNHIYKEDNILYPMASQQLPQVAYISMSDKFNLEEIRRLELGEVVEMETLANELISVN